MAQGIPPAAAMASYRRSRLPFDRLQTPKMPRRPFAMLPILAVSLCCSSVAACRLPAQSPTRATPARTTPNFAGKRYTPTSATGATPAGKSHHKAKASPRPQQWLLIGVQGCRLTGFKLETPKMPRRPFAMLPILGRPVAPSPRPQQSPATAMASYRRSRLSFDRLQTPKMLRRPFAMLPILGRPVAPSPVAVSPCCSSVAAAAMASYRRSRLPFDRLQTPKMPRRPFAMLPILRRPVAPSPVAVSPCCSSVAACRLPAQSPTRATPACTTPNFAGKRYPNKPNRRHARRQKPPQGHSNGSRHPPGRSNGFL